MKKKRYNGFFARWILLAVLAAAVLTGCSGLSSLIGPGSDYKNQQTKSEKDDKENQGDKNQGDNKETEKKNSTYGNYVPKSPQLTDEVIEKIDTLMQVIDYYYLYDYDEEEMTDMLYRAVLASLGDPYSVYYTKEEYDAFMEDSSGSYCGIGVVVQQDRQTGEVLAVRPYLNCPGYEAGIRPGDKILAVDGTDITGMDLNAAVALIRGEEGTDVTITVKRENEVFDVVATRRHIDVETVTYKMLDDHIGYIAVDEFDEVTAKQFSKALDDLIAQDMEALVIDLRNNPGGLLDIVVDMLDEILPEGVIVSVKDKKGTTKKYSSDKNSKLEVPLAVLINGNSASASEIFAGAVKDYGVGTLVGTTTFGKGIVQSLFSMRDGSGLKLTIEDYYTPNGTSIHNIGVAPDVEIDLPDELKVLVEIPEEQDTQLQKAIEILKKQK